MADREQELLIELREVREEKQKAFAVAHMPACEKEFNGTYHRYINSSSGDSEKWWIYYFVEKVIEIYRQDDGSPIVFVSGWSFEFNPDGRVLIAKEDRLAQCMLQQKTNRVGFAKAYSKMLKYLAELPGK